MNMMKSDIANAISRIIKMESLFDELTELTRNSPDKLRSPSAQEAIYSLSEYYTNGDWLSDYELDEQRALSKELKRGILSQDGLYELLSEINKIINN